jgi:hypothetical protein
MKWTTATVLASLALATAGAAVAAEKRYPEPPSPGNPFPRRPADDPPLKNPIPRETRNPNPTNDPDIWRGYRDHYRDYWRNK